MPNARKRAKNMDDAVIEQIMHILDGWAGDKLTWDLLVAQIMHHTYTRYTKRALYKYERIRMAFDITKSRLENKQGVSKRKISKELQFALNRIKKLTAKNIRLEKEKDQLLEQFCRWAYNANNRGWSIDILNQPLPQKSIGAK